MCYSGSLEHRVGYLSQHSHVDYSSTNLQIYEFSSSANRARTYTNSDDYSPNLDSPRLMHTYTGSFALISQKYAGESETYHNASVQHLFTPLAFLNPSRPRTRFVDDKEETKRIANEVLELMRKEKLPDDISISVLSLNEFRAVHSLFGPWSNGILGFSINGKERKIFVRENDLDELILVIGHEIGHVLTKTLSNKHDEEAKAFAFSIEWAKTIKKHNVANLGLNIKDETDFSPAKNGLHDIAFGFVGLMIRNGRSPIRLHDDLARKYLSIFDKHYLHM